MGESNSPLNLGRVACYHYTNPAVTCSRDISVQAFILRARNEPSRLSPKPKTRKCTVPCGSFPRFTRRLLRRISTWVFRNWDTGMVVVFDQNSKDSSSSISGYICKTIRKLFRGTPSTCINHCMADWMTTGSAFTTQGV